MHRPAKILAEYRNLANSGYKNRDHVMKLRLCPSDRHGISFRMSVEAPQTSTSRDRYSFFTNRPSVNEPKINERRSRTGRKILGTNPGALPIIALRSSLNSRRTILLQGSWDSPNQAVFAFFAQYCHNSSNSISDPDAEETC
jgi:hypothetical protein